MTSFFPASAVNDGHEPNRKPWIMMRHISRHCISIRPNAPQIYFFGREILKVGNVFHFKKKRIIHLKLIIDAIQV